MKYPKQKTETKEQRLARHVLEKYWPAPAWSPHNFFEKYER